ncbi:DUF7314 family protein [Candidatus Halobonum tyrrellensis]|uniref:DUF7314 domain-containing protein n=1 Tax=Candidatus Halobonum tyrrellensis G22 TaxID=1324957 RepID=V4GTI3_9EURY|nr:hypothetical protein [Candidatus Halobonum tyrrellensis]ESP88406.1 hypothetical protein K933_09792 [Candidatus Halobonum tyrrellensis G22]
MADEFVKGLGLFTGAGLGWLVLAGWYRTESFESPRQLIAAPPDPETLFDAIGIFLGDVFFWTALLGAFTFWLLVPAINQFASRGQSS